MLRRGHDLIFVYVVEADFETFGKMNVLEGILRFRIQDRDYTVKQSGFGPDYQEGLERWYEEQGSLDESVSYWEHFYGRKRMLCPTVQPVNATCDCVARSDCNSTTHALELLKLQADCKVCGGSRQL